MQNRICFISAVVASVCLGVNVSAQTATFARPQARIVHGIDEDVTVRLPGNVYPLTNAASSSRAADLGTPMEHMILQLKGDATQEAQLEQLIAEQHDPKSPLYHKFLSPQGFGAQFGVAASDIVKVTGWLQSHGFTVEEVPAGNRTVIFSGTAAQVAEAFKTEIRQYSVKGAPHFANASDPQIPAALAETVAGVVKLHDFRHSSNIQKLGAPIGEVNKSQFSASQGNYLAPADYATIYDINPLYNAGINGTGQTIAVLARSDISMSDVQSFRTTFGLKANNPQFVINGNDPGVVSGDNEETTLDTEWSGAVAPNAAIKVIISASTNSADGIDLSAAYAVNNNIAPIITMSYGQCEASMGSTEVSFYNSLWKQAVAQGQTVFVSAGDSGAAGCSSGSASTGSNGAAVNGLCTSPYSTCVGGTEFAEGNNTSQYWQSGNSSVYGSAISYIPEKVWNESGSVSGGSGLWGGGGGASIVYTKPSWQAGLGVPADGKRDVPDVSLTAASHDGYVITINGSLYPIGGTSASAPSFAGLMALVDQKMGARQGLANSILYPMAAQQNAGGAKIFHDTTVGNNTVPGVTGFSATTGYDLASGLGSVDAALLVNNWGSGSSTGNSLGLSASASSLNVIEGQTGQITITSAASAGLKSAVALTVGGAPTGVTATFSAATIASPGSGSVVLNIAVTSAATPGTYALTVTGTGGGQTGSANVSVVIPTPTFVMASTTLANLIAGSTAQLSVSVTPQNGFSSAVALTVSGLPSGVTSAFTPTSITGTAGGTSTLKLTAAATVAGGTYPLTITGAKGNQTVHATASLVIPTPTFTLAASGTTASLNSSTPAQFTVKLTPVNGFSSAMNLSATGLESGLTASFSPASVSGLGGSSTVTLSATTAAALGSHPFTITATGGNVTQTVAIATTLTAAPSCTLASNPANATLYAGQSASFQLACGSVTGTFTSPLALSVTGAPTGMTAQLASATLAAGSTTTLNVTTTNSTAGGTYNLAYKVVGSGYTQTLAIPVTVSSTFGLAASTNALTVTAGSTGQVTLTTTPYGSFNSAITLAANTSNASGGGITAAFSKTVVAAPGNGSAVATLSVPSNTPAGTYAVLLSGNGGQYSQSTTVNVTVLSAPSFSLSVSAATLTMAQGASVPVTISTGNYANGFKGQVSISFSGLGAGMTYSLTSANTTNNTVNNTMTFTAATNTPVGTYPVTVTATGQGVTHTAVITMTVTTKH